MIVRRIPIRNVTNHDLTVHVEPWGEQHVLPTNDFLEVVFYGPDSGKPELLVGDSEISVYGWEGCRVFVLKNNACVSQPSLQKIINQLCASEHVDKSNFEWEPEIIKYAQEGLDTAEFWDKAGRESAYEAVAKVAPLLTSLNNEAFVWKFCQRVLYSRGVFLHENTNFHRKLFTELRRSSGDLVRILGNWYEASEQHDKLADRVKAD